MKRVLMIAVVLGVALSTLPCLAQAMKARPRPAKVVDDGDQEPPLVLKVYDVADIQLDVAGPAKGIDDLNESGSSLGGNGMITMQGMSAGPPPDNSHAQRNGGNAPLSDTGDQIRDIVDSLILGTESAGVGGREDARVLGDALAVSASEKHHAQIATFLDTLRKRAAARKMVAVEVHWLWLTEEQLKSLMPADGTDRATAHRIVDDAAWLRLAKERAKEDNDFRLGYHAAVTCMNGQTVLTNGGRQSRFISTMIPVVGDATPPAPPTPSASSPTERSTGYQPVTTMIQEGAAVQLKPILCEGNQVLLDIRARAVEIQSRNGVVETADARAKADSRGGIVRELASVVERPDVLNHRLDTTLRAPLGRRVLVGGITRSTVPNQGEPNLYVFVEASVFDPQAAGATTKRK
jgi:hypothetical protein